MDAAQVVDAIDAGLRAAATPERAAKERVYLRSTIEHYGTSVPDTRAVVRAHLPRGSAPARDLVIAVAERLWQTPVHERRSASVMVLGIHVGLLDRTDVPMVETFLREAKTWALVDPLCTEVMGYLVSADPSLGATLDRWAVDPDDWIRRASLLSLLVPLRSGDGDWDRFAKYADSMLDEREFFFRKAIGWVLRDTAKKRPDLVFSWLLPAAARASGVTLREAVKPLDELQRAQILAAR